MESAFRLLYEGGIIMIPLLITSVISLAVVIERSLFLRRSRIVQPEIVEMINNIKKLSDIENLMARLRNFTGPFVNIIRVGIENRNMPKEYVREAILDQGRQEARILERGLVILETAAGIAPLLGLLGTVLGMIEVFEVISKQGVGQTQSLSGGISQALITTVVGLSIAIPVLVAYNYFVNKVEELVLEIEKHSNKLLLKLEKITE